MPIGALYIHIPFCHARCAYCDFHSHAASGAALAQEGARYADTLIERIECLSAAGAFEALRTVYIGGGTPTVLGGDLVRIVSAVSASAYPVEFSCEANPESLDAELAAELVRAGVTRFSLGVQSFDDGELARIGRLHDADGARVAIARARATGAHVSCDLMCGLPGQTPESWERTLAEAVAAGVDHISVYPLTLEEDTPLARAAQIDPSLEPDEDFQAWCMERARTVLREAGLEPYEVASYARPGHACRHNNAYWTGVSYLGLGPSAASMLDRETLTDLAGRCASELLPDTAALDPSCARVRFVEGEAGEGSHDVECLTVREAAAEDLMLGMRMTHGVSEENVTRAGRALGSAALDAALVRAEAEGLATWVLDVDGARRFAPTERGWLLGNELYELMWDLAEDR